MADCPAPPQWRPIIGMPPREVTMAANLVIEEAYRTQNGEHGVLFGSQFEEGFISRGVMREIRLPDGAPNKEFGNKLLARIRGPKGGPRKPDILDFNDRAFYEIKPVSTFNKKKHEIIRDHRALYSMAALLVEEFNEEKRQTTSPANKTLVQENPWDIRNAKWMPPSCLNLPGLKSQYKLETFSTDYNTDPNRRGIIIYRVWKRVRRKQEEEQRAVQVVMDGKDDKYEKLIASPGRLPEIIGPYDPDEPRHIIIVPRHIHEILSKRPLIEIPQNQSTPSPLNTQGPGRLAPPQSMMSKAGTMIRNHPYIAAGAVIVAVATGGYAIYVLGAAGEGAAAAGGLARVEGAQIISLAGRRLAAQGAAEVAKKAAAVLVFFGIVKSVRGDEVSFSRIETMKAIPLSSVAPYRTTNSALSSGMCIADPPEDLPSASDDICVGDEVMFDSRPHSVVATFCAFPNNLSCEE
jgi:hypothetical protein